MGRRGRKRTLTDDQIEEMRRRYAAGETPTELGSLFECSRQTIHRYLTEETIRKAKARSVKWNNSAHFIVSSYRSQAKKRSLSFNLTKEHVLSLIGKPCFYCGTEPKQCKTGGIRNGIDRVNNSVGYTPANAVSCCWECNHVKGSRSALDFIAHAKRIAAHNATNEQ